MRGNQPDPAMRFSDHVVDEDLIQDPLY